MQYKDSPPNKKIGDYVWNHQAFLGEGAFGKVYLGHPANDLKELVAVKQMDMKNLKTEEMKKALANEISILKMLKDNYTCGMIKDYQTTNNYYIILPFCNGGDLRQKLNKLQNKENDKYICEADALQILKDLLLGMQEMHKNDLAHRDLKPENSLIHNGIHKIADYGFSTKIGGQPMKQQCGTPLYMSPQILQNQPYTEKNDVWAIGMIYYEILFGKTPWDVKCMQDLHTMPKKIPVKFPFNHPISDMSKKFILGCLAYEEKDRLSWEQIFQSDIFTQTKEVHHQIVQEQSNIKKVNLSNKTLSVLKKFQSIVNDNQLDLIVLFNKLDKQGDGKLDVNELSVLFKNIDPSFTTQMCQEIFSAFDTSNDGQIELEEFKKILVYTCYDEQKQENFMHIELKANKIIKDLKLKIQHQDIDLAFLFKKLDVQGDGTLDIGELAKLIKIVDNNISQQELNLVFNLFDADKSGNITFEEFSKILFVQKSVIQDQNQSINKSNMTPNSLALLSKVKNAIVNNHLDMEVAFKHFDLDGNGYLDKKEFENLVKVFYGKAELADITETFVILDSSKQSKVNINDFKSILN